MAFFASADGLFRRDTLGRSGAAQLCLGLASRSGLGDVTGGAVQGAVDFLAVLETDHAAGGYLAFERKRRQADPRVGQRDACTGRDFRVELLTIAFEVLQDLVQFTSSFMLPTMTVQAAASGSVEARCAARTGLSNTGVPCGIRTRVLTVKG